VLADEGQAVREISQRMDDRVGCGSAFGLRYGSSWVLGAWWASRVRNKFSLGPDGAYHVRMFVYWLDFCLPSIRLLLACSLTPHPSQRFPHNSIPTAPTRKYAHNPKPNIEQSQRIRHQAPHPSHPPYTHKHPRTAKRAPSHRHTR
jgi:hypothetical protein